MRLSLCVRHVVIATAVAGTIAMLGHHGAPAIQAQTTGPILAVSDRANAHVSLAAEGAFVAAVWSASRPSGTTDIYAAFSRDSGATFQAPVRVNTLPGDARVNGEQPPRVAVATGAGPLPAIAVVWTTKGPNGTRLMTSRSVDGGRTFSKSAVVRDSDAAGNRGWEAITAGPNGRFFTAWLDHRKLAQPQVAKVEGEHHHGGSPTQKSGGGTAPPATDGVAMAQLSQLYVGSTDGAIVPVAVTGGVCYCCKTAIVSNGQGGLFVAWRHVYAGNMRDIAFSASRDGGRTFSSPVRISEDKWQIDGCPDDGPAMDIGGAGRIHVVWPTVVVENGGPVKALFHSTTRDGRTFSARIRLPSQGHANHPQVALLPDGALMVAWDESGSGSRRLAFARGTLDSSGRMTFVRRTSVSGIGTYPVLAATAKGVLAAWTSADGDGSVIRIAEVR